MASNLRRRLHRKTLKKTTHRAAPARPVAQAPGTSLSDAPVTITVSQLNDLQAQVKQAQEQNVRLEQHLAEVKALDPTGRVANLQALAHAELEVVRFAIANLPPSEIPKWPYEAVDRIGKLLHALPDFNADAEVLVEELKLFVADIKEHELARARKRDELIANAPREIPKAALGEALDRGSSPEPEKLQ